MAQGLQVFNAAGAIFWDTNMFIGRSIGYVDVGTGSGTVVDDRLTTGTPWAFPVLEASSVGAQPGSANFFNHNLWIAAPSLVFSGNTLLWSRVTPSPNDWETPVCRIYYGVR